MSDGGINVPELQATCCKSTKEKRPVLLIRWHRKMGSGRGSGRSMFAARVWSRIALEHGHGNASQDVAPVIPTMGEAIERAAEFNAP